MGNGAGENLFADRVRRVDLMNGVVRIELENFDPASSKEGDKEPGTRPGPVLAMPLDGFVRSTALFEHVIKQMLDRGILKRAADGKTETAADADKATQSAEQK